MENDVLYNRIMNVVHQEYGSGSTAVANPDGEATDSLEKIQIGDDIYSISGGGGGGMIITISQSGGDVVLDKNYNEIKAAIDAGIIPFAIFQHESGLNIITTVSSYGYAQEKYAVEIYSQNGMIDNTFLSDTADGVMTLYQGG